MADLMVLEILDLKILVFHRDDNARQATHFLNIKHRLLVVTCRRLEGTPASPLD